MSLICVDIGNSNIVIGIFEGAELKTHWRLATRKRSTADEYVIILKELIRNDPAPCGPFDGAIISCVVPSLEHVFKNSLKSAFGLKPVVVGPGARTGMPILTDNPREVGADRIVNAVAAFERLGGPVIVVDFGTAVTFDYVTEKGEYAGGAIAPGVSISTDALFTSAAKLPRVGISRPRAIVGKSTAESLKAGIFYGTVSMVDGIVERMKQETKTDSKTGAKTGPKVVATGGMAGLIAPECRSIDEVDEFLTLKGLRVVYEINNK